ncbi:hypothetical protein [Sphingobacterium sp. DR205]|uniref:hypothetical protein n=1 Tax=Sphingobacterium sp. DR205 TaxID=2713573 RepID=UPI0013E50B98|nr:hypothetical protein [Sphingobacterium sp. DR205]QIH33866.1 hypothetical protein G6053_13670 [Sphingobacterium sp. DR205]
MTTKKYAEEFYKKTKSIRNIMVEKMFSDYVLYRNGKRIGVLFDNKLLLISTENLKKIFPNAIEEKTFDWGYYKLIQIEYNDNFELLEKAIITTYDDLYFQKDFVTDISYLFKVNRSYQDSIIKIYNLHITFLRFCYDKGLLKINPLDKQDRILHMNFLNNDLTESGTKIFYELYNKWLVYTDKNDDKTDERIINTKMLEKYYLGLNDKMKI